MSGSAITFTLSSCARIVGSMIFASVNWTGVTWRSATAAAITYGSEWSAVSLVRGSYFEGSARMSAARASE